MKRLALLLLAGCPSSYGFHGHVLAARAEAVHVLAIQTRDGLEAPELAPIANAHVDCTGCDGAITVDAHGRFRVGLDGDHPVTLRVSAPGFASAEIEIPKPPATSQAGPADFIIVLRPRGEASR